MVKLVDDEKLRRLIRIGRERGAVGIDDLRAALPVELMTPAELAQAVERLEDAGVPVELEGWLSRPAPGQTGETPMAGAPVPPEPEPTAPPAAAYRPGPAHSSTRGSRPATALGIALAVVLIVVVALLLFSVA